MNTPVSPVSLKIQKNFGSSSSLLFFFSFVSIWNMALEMELDRNGCKLLSASYLEYRL